MLEVAWNAVPWQTITPVGLCVTFTWLVVRGKLVPRAWVDRMDTEHRKQLEYMETTLTEQRGTISSLVEQNAELSVSGRLSVALLESLQKPKPLSSNTDPGSGHVAPSIAE